MFLRCCALLSILFLLSIFCLEICWKLPCWNSKLGDLAVQHICGLQQVRGSATYSDECIMELLCAHANRGRFRSKPWAAALEEARKLVDSGVVELNLIAEDTNQYAIRVHSSLHN